MLCMPLARAQVPCGRAPDLEDYAPGAGGAGHPRNSSSNAASGPQALPPASPLQPPTTPADASSVALAAAAHPSSISAPQNAMVPAEALASTGAASSAAMVTAQSGLAVSGSHANANGASSLLTSSAEEQLHSGSAAVASSAAAGGEGVAVPHGWVVIDAAAGAAAGELELDEEAEEDGEGGGKRAAEGAEGSAAMNVALQVRPDAWHHLAPAAAPGAQLLSSHASGTQLHSASSAAAGGKQLSAGANSQSTAAAAVASLQAKSPAAAAKAEASMMMKQTWCVCPCALCNPAAQRRRPSLRRSCDVARCGGAHGVVWPQDGDGVLRPGHGAGRHRSRLAPHRARLPPLRGARPAPHALRLSLPLSLPLPLLCGPWRSARSQRGKAAVVAVGRLLLANRTAGQLAGRGGDGVRHCQRHAVPPRARRGARGPHRCARAFILLPRRAPPACAAACGMPRRLASHRRSELLPNPL